MFNVDRFPIRSDSIRLGKTPPTRISQKKDLSNGFGALVLSYLEVERAVHAVLLRPEDARQVFRHDDDDDDDERRIYTEGKIWSLKKVANFVGEKIRVKRDTHTHYSRRVSHAHHRKNNNGECLGSFESIEKRQTRNAFFERFERNLDRVIEEDTITRTKKNRHHHSVPNAA